jgi:hypothetical protein
MIVDRYDRINLFALIPQLTLEMDPELAALDHLLEDDTLLPVPLNVMLLLLLRAQTRKVSGWNIWPHLRVSDQRWDRIVPYCRQVASRLTTCPQCGPLPLSSLLGTDTGRFDLHRPLRCPRPLGTTWIRSWFHSGHLSLHTHWERH